MSKHTPGPWECELGHENGDFQINSTGRRWKAIANATANVLGADAVYDEEAQANAKLIAAAPDGTDIPVSLFSEIFSDFCLRYLTHYVD